MQYGKAAICILTAAVIFKFVLQRKTQYDSDAVQGMNVIVTGASSGIGEQIAYKFASMGANLVVTARTTAKLKKVVEKCKQLGSPQAYYVAASQYSYDNASLVVTTALEKLGDIDVLILNHIGQSYFGGYRYNAHNVEKLMMSNMLTHAHMAGVAMTSLMKRKGRISVVSSGLAVSGGIFALPYATTKKALNGFFTSLRHELIYNETQVSVTLCHLGLIDTLATQEYAKHISSPSSSKQETADEIIRGTMARETNVYYPGQCHTVQWAAYPRSIAASMKARNKSVETNDMDAHYFV